MSSRLHVLAVALALALFLAQLPVACAADRKIAALPIDDAAARVLYESGERYYELGRYPEALRDFDEAYERSGRSALLYNMGRCHEQLGHTEEAVRAYRDFLTAQPDAPGRAALEEHIADLLVRAHAVAAPMAPPPPRMASSKRRPAYPFVVGGVGLGLLVASLGTGVSALRINQQLEAHCPLGQCPATYPEALLDRANGQQLAVATDVLIGLGAATTTAGLICLIVELARTRVQK